MEKNDNKRNNEKLYLVHTVSIQKKEEIDFEQELSILKIKYKSWQNKTVEDYKKFLIDNESMFHKSKYNIEDDIVGYYTDLDLAKNDVENNMFDINDGGSFSYVVIIPTITNTFYPIYLYENSHNEIFIYKFNAKEDMYIKIDENIQSEEIKNEVNAIRKYFE